MPRPIPPPPHKLFENLQREHGFEPVPVQGTVPDYVRGTLYRNGAGLLEQFGRRYAHVFESDGAISALRLNGTQAHAAARVVQSEGLTQERAAQRHLGGSAAPWLTRMRQGLAGKYKNNANTHVVSWQGRLLALMEGGKPTELDPDTLATLGETDLNGTIPAAFSAHPHRVARRKTLYNFGMRYGKQTELCLFALPDQGKPTMIGRVPIAKPVMLHDFVVTDNYLVFFVAPVQLVLWRLMLAIGGFTAALRWTPNAGTEIIVVPIDAPERPVRFEVDAFFASHFAGAFEEDGELVVDYVRYPDSEVLLVLGDGMKLTWTGKDRHALGYLHRARIDIERKRFESHPRWDVACEFPRVLEQAEGHALPQIWMQSSRYIEDVMRFGVSRIDASGEVCTNTLEPGQMCSEPVHVPDPNGPPGAGSVLSLVFDTLQARSHVVVLDAMTLSEQARIQLSQPIPLTFHGSWVPG